MMKTICGSLINFINSLSSCDITFSVGIYCLSAIFVFSHLADKKNNTLYLFIYLLSSIIVLFYNATLNYLTIGQFILFNVCLSCKLFVIIGFVFAIITIIEEIFIENETTYETTFYEKNNDNIGVATYNNFYNNNEKKYGEPYTSVIESKKNYNSNKKLYSSYKDDTKKDISLLKEKLFFLKKKFGNKMYSLERDIKRDIDNLSKNYNETNDKLYRLLKDRDEKIEQLKSFTKTSNDGNFTKKINEIITNSGSNFANQIEDILNQQQEIKKSIVEKNNLIESKNNDIKNFKEEIKDLLEKRDKENKVDISNNYSIEIDRIRLEKDKEIAEIQKQIKSMHDERELKNKILLDQQILNEKKANNDKDIIINELRKQIENMNSQKNEEVEKIKQQIQEFENINKNKEEQIEKMKKQLENMDFEINKINKNDNFEEQKQMEQQNNILTTSTEENITLNNKESKSENNSVESFDKNNLEEKLLLKTEIMINKRDEIIKNDMTEMRRDINMLGKSLQSAVDKIAELFDFMTFAFKHRQ